jgi:putative aldouronate transport system permease protein
MYFRPIVIGSSIWKSSGWGTVVYLAALAGLDPTLYEAAIIDGANRFQRILYISFPCILGTISVMLILRLGNLMSNGFEQIWLLQNDLNKSTAEVLETYSYQVGLREGRYSYSAAVGMFQSLVSFLLIFSSNYISKKVGGDGLW